MKETKEIIYQKARSELEHYLKYGGTTQFIIPQRHVTEEGIFLLEVTTRSAVLIAHITSKKVIVWGAGFKDILETFAKNQGRQFSISQEPISNNFTKCTRTNWIVKTPPVEHNRVDNVSTDKFVNSEWVTTFTTDRLNQIYNDIPF